jgi:amidohydrolase
MDIKPFIQHRKYLHQHPELSNFEKETSKYIQQQLLAISPSVEIHEVAENGILAIFKGKNQGKHVMFRCELDALPIAEENTFKHQSKYKGVSHKCGHDGHMAIMLAFAAHLQENQLQKGKVSLLFQPAEENGEGAKQVIEDKVFKEHCNPDYVFALHNVPGFEKNTIIIRPGTFTPSVISAKIKLTGKTAHAAEPENGINPVYAIAELLQSIKTLEVTDANSGSLKIITPVFVEVGSESYGVAAGDGVVGLTFRTTSNSMMDKLKLSFLNILMEVVQKNNLRYEIEWLQEFQSVKNDEEAVGFIQKAAIEAQLSCLIKEEPFKWGEDFGLFTQQFTGAMFALGAGKDTPALHNPDYDFPDELISSGSKIFIKILEQLQ